ncbi:hypothetical protein AB0B30_32540 [Streptomyces narbonensis]|uniref:Uncharacterized protein n=1 Tax=Streptomyces narbonensis TaxID=67333 RepID=A0ABV3CIX9_9ACTN
MTDRWFNLSELRQIMAEQEQQMREKQERVVRQYQELMAEKEDSDG